MDEKAYPNAPKILNKTKSSTFTTQSNQFRSIPHSYSRLHAMKKAANKRNRQESEETSSEDLGHEKTRQTCHGKGKSVPPPQSLPPSEHVEEFFAILRRMHFARKYLENSVLDNGRNGWTALETDLREFKGVGCGSESGKKAAEAVAAKAVINVVGLDLNSVPEAQSDSD
ncbi:hypothetical protein Nepgr_019302 [Nepenthes gracilis]|uniref:Uncharacterized protein n=1 Tax=Nepenthes gracilis TaxID=150966 RepID=A0AAD3XV65_NEPGR|nr:hypothetical protein Nepgr_019302 [Nepenthes gracilis]